MTHDQEFSVFKKEGLMFQSKKGINMHKWLVNYAIFITGPNVMYEVVQL
jgi:hypothetical protein